jgi:hypothetical protein
MTQNNPAFKVALAAAQQLSPKLQKQLAEQLIMATNLDKDTTVVYLQRLSPRKQARLTQLMDKHNEGKLKPAEQLELNQLGSEVDQMLLANSHGLARALRPELFDERGKPMKRRFRQALRESPLGRAESTRESVQG